MERTMRDFLWARVDGNLHCNIVAWDQVCKPKEKEGLGIENISEE